MGGQRRRHGAAWLGLALALAMGCAREPRVSLTCPRGATPRHAGPEHWCETPRGVRHGPVWTLHPDGSLASHGVAKRGHMQGLFQQWRRDGTRSSAAELRDGALSGSFRMWDARGALLFEGRHDAHGEMDGTWRRWWPNGRLRTQWQMRSGRHHGPTRGWHEDGSPRLEGHHTEGRRTGRWTTWASDGTLERTCLYDDAGRLLEGDCPPGVPQGDAIPERPATTSGR